MTEEKMQEVIKSECEDSLFYQAIIKLIQMRLEEETNGVLQPLLDDAGRHYNAGRAAAMVDMITTLEGYRS